MKICIGLSGGVDSSVAARLLLEEGHELIACTMRTYDTERSLRETEDARAVAEILGIPFYVEDYREEFKNEVISYFVNEYIHGRTPNPCVICNRHVKWEALMNCAAKHGAQKVATGHYARICRDEASGRYAVRKAVTQEKDQSYALFNLSSEQLMSTVLPLGGYSKDEVREKAKEAGLFTAEKPDSQEICFIPDKDYAGFIERYCEGPGRMSFKEAGISWDSPGNFVDEYGNVLGRHSGIINYTIGQRKGLGIALGKRMFVKEIRPVSNEVVLADADSVWTGELFFNEFNRQLLADDISEEGIDAVVKIRYADKGTRAHISRCGSGIYRACFEKPVRAATPGQAAVLYDEEDRILGGGLILKR